MPPNPRPTDRSVATVGTRAGDPGARFFVFGLPRRVSEYGPKARAIIDAALERARRTGTAEIDVDELIAADRHDRRDRVSPAHPGAS